MNVAPMDVAPLTFGEQVDSFEISHPDIAGYFTEMLGTYIACQKKSPNDLELIYAHLKTCEWCPAELEARKRLKDQFTPELAMRDKR